jgi:hypothetical protein
MDTINWLNLFAQPFAICSCIALLSKGNPWGWLIIICSLAYVIAVVKFFNYIRGIQVWR